MDNLKVINKKSIIGIFVMILLVGLVVASSHIITREDVTISLTSEEETKWDELGGLNLSYEYAEDYNYIYTFITSNTGYNFLKTAKVKSYMDECASWNLTLGTRVGNQSFINSSIVNEIDPLKFNGDFVQGECVSQPRINKTELQKETEMNEAVRVLVSGVAKVEMKRDLEADKIITREGDISVGGR